MQFVFDACTPDGKIVQGQLRAKSLQEARGQLHGRGLLIISLQECKRKTRWHHRLRLALVGRRSKLRFYQRFLLQLSNLSRSGLPLATCLEILIDETKQLLYQQALAEIKRSVGQGRSLAQAISEQDHLFPPLLVEMTAAAEAVGKLEDIYDRLADTYQGELEFRRKVATAAIYPLFVLSLSLLGTMVISRFALPQIRELLFYLDADLPVTTQILLWLGKRELWPLFLYLIGAGIIFYLLLRFTPGGKKIRYFFLLKTPIIGPLILHFHLSQTCHILSLCLSCGTPLLAALSITRKTAGIEPIANEIERLEAGSQSGLSLTSQLRAIEGIPRLIVQLVRVGESTGRMSDMLDQAGTVLYNKVRYSLSVAVAWIEPLLIIVAGAVIAVTVSGIMLPLLAAMDALN